MKATAENRKVGAILKGLRDGSLVPKPPFQRRTVWTNPDKVEFIKTILMGYPFPEIYFAASQVDTLTGDATEVLVDGQQRVKTIEDYFKGNSPFKTSRSVQRYRDLPEENKQSFLGYDVAVRNFGLLDDDSLRDIFTRMNRTSYDLNEMERYNAIYLGEFKSFCEQISEFSFFRDNRLFSSNDIRRMKDVSYVASLVATMMSTYFNRDDEVETYFERYNENFFQKTEVYSRIIAAIELLMEMKLPKDSRAWRKVDFYCLFVEVDRQLFKEKRRPNILSTTRSLQDFFAEVAAFREGAFDGKEAKEYSEASLRNTNDRSQRIARGRILRSLLEAQGSTKYEVELVDYVPAQENE